MWMAIRRLLHRGDVAGRPDGNELPPRSEYITLHRVRVGHDVEAALRGRLTRSEHESIGYEQKSAPHRSAPLHDLNLAAVKPKQLADRRLVRRIAALLGQ